MASDEHTQDRVVINNSSLSELKVACDNGLKKILEARGYKEMHTHTDVKLILGYVGALFCIIDFIYSWKYSFSQTKWFSYLSVSVYAITSALAVVYTYVVQRDTFFVGYNNNKGYVISAGSVVKNGDPNYTLTLTTRPIRGRQDPPVYNSKPLVCKAPFATWFYEDGEFDQALFKSWLTSAISEVMTKKTD